MNDLHGYSEASLIKRSINEKTEVILLHLMALVKTAVGHLVRILWCIKSGCRSIGFKDGCYGAFVKIYCAGGWFLVIPPILIVDMSGTLRCIVPHKKGVTGIGKFLFSNENS